MTKQRGRKQKSALAPIISQRDIMTYLPRLWHIFILFSLGIILLCGPALAQGKNQPFQRAAKRYAQAAAHYHTMVGFKKKNPSRTDWLYSASLFQKAYNSDPDNKIIAPKALYMLGKVYKKSYQTYHQKEDLKKSARFYEDLVFHFPDHDLADSGMAALGQIVLKNKNNPDVVDKERLLAKAVATYSGEPEVKSTAGMLLRRLKDHARERAGLGDLPASSRPAANSAFVTGPIRFWSSANYTRVVIETSAPIRFKEHILKAVNNAPRRLYVDLFDTRIPRTFQNPVLIQDGLLKRSRAAQFDPNTTRVVLDMESVGRFKIFSLQEPFRVVIDVHGKEVRQLVARKRKIRPRRQGHHYSLAEQLGLGVKTVIIDPGHGGKDPGAIGITGLQEKDVTLRVARQVRDILRHKGYKVILTRSDDTFIPLEERTAIANTKDGDLFISIHANSAPNAKAYGLETYYLSLATTPEERAAAALENASSALQLSALQDILSDLMKNTKINESAKMAKVMQRAVVNGLQQRYPGIKNLGVKKAPFIVLIGANMPSVLTEIGFVSNKSEEKRLRQASYLKHLAQHIAHGIESYSRTLH